MKNRLANLIIAALAFLGGCGTFLASKDWITSADAELINKAGTSAAAPLAAFITAIAIAVAAKVFHFKISDDSPTGDSKDSGAKSGGSSLLLLFGMTMATLLAGAGLSSCSNFTLPKLPEGTSVSALYQGKSGAGVGITWTGNIKPPATVELIPEISTKKTQTLPLVSVLPIPDPVTPLVPRLGEPPLPPPPAMPPQIGLPPGPFVTPTK